MMDIFPLVLLMYFSTVFSYYFDSLENISSNIEVNLSLAKIPQRYNFNFGEFNLMITNISHIFSFREKTINDDNKEFVYSDITVMSMFDILINININKTSNILLNRTTITTEAAYNYLYFIQSDSLAVSYNLPPMIKGKFKLIEWDLVQYDYFKPIYSDYQEEISNALEYSFKDVINATISQYPMSISEYYFKKLFENIETHEYYLFKNPSQKLIYIKLTDIKYKAKYVQASKYDCKINNIKMKAHLYGKQTQVATVLVREAEYGMFEIIMKEINVFPEIIKDLDKYIRRLFNGEFSKQTKFEPFSPRLIY